jgi:hypothetical protein
MRDGRVLEGMETMRSVNPSRLRICQPRRPNTSDSSEFCFIYNIVIYFDLLLTAVSFVASLNKSQSHFTSEPPPRGHHEPAAAPAARYTI